METEDLQKQNQKLKELISLKTDMVSIMSHQARTSFQGQMDHQNVLRWRFG